MLTLNTHTWRVREHRAFPCPASDIGALFASEPERWLSILLRIAYLEAHQEAVRAGAPRAIAPASISVTAGPVDARFPDPRTVASLEWSVTGFGAVLPRFEGTVSCVESDLETTDVLIQGSFYGALASSVPLLTGRRAVTKVASRLLHHIHVAVAEQLAGEPVP
ncbi:MAG TPA: hypothetical protein VM600_09195 [Actinomycetota bacterium]|nr:hypothetical protein [Actinomycetota bacterium]